MPLSAKFTLSYCQTILYGTTEKELSQKMCLEMFYLLTVDIISLTVSK